MRRITVACVVFAIGIAVGDAVLRPGHHGPPKLEREVSGSVAAASGGDVVHVTCVSDHCGVVVRRAGASACQGWVVPLDAGVPGAPRRAALVDC
ncbi:MAG TPA: hypothetical protein VGU02_06050 [Gaiellaceae bacterium]|nr:hypothetical protein [Gaiellaceae bacterium]